MKRGSIEKAKIVACSIWGVPLNELDMKTRKRDYVYARNFVMWYSRVVLKEDYYIAGGHVGKDHATAIRAVKKAIKDLRETDPNFRNKFLEFCEMMEVQPPTIKVLV